MDDGTGKALVTVGGHVHDQCLLPGLGDRRNFNKVGGCFDYLKKIYLRSILLSRLLYAMDPQLGVYNSHH